MIPRSYELRVDGTARATEANMKTSDHDRYIDQCIQAVRTAREQGASITLRVVGNLLFPTASNGSWLPFAIDWGADLERVERELGSQIRKVYGD